MKNVPNLKYDLESCHNFEFNLMNRSVNSIFFEPVCGRRGGLTVFIGLLTLLDTVTNAFGSLLGFVLGGRFFLGSAVAGGGPKIKIIKLFCEKRYGHIFQI